MITKNDASVLKWIFNSINDSFQENQNNAKSPTGSFLVSLEIIQALSEFYSTDKSEVSIELPEYILNILESIVVSMNSLNTESLLQFLECMRITTQNLYKIKRFNKLDRLAELLLDMIVQNQSSLSFNTDIILKLSFIFKVYAIK